MEKDINLRLLCWYNKNKRDLPWRKIYKNNLPNPYYIFVSEYMLQQTTVSTVISRFNTFIKIWPKIDDFAKISEKTILSFWTGLGYYSRAINILKAAKIIKKKFNSKIPTNYEELISLPGIGDYTAKAILGIGFNKPVMPIDSNIERIILRIYAIKLPAKKYKTELEYKSKSFISKDSSTKLIQAFMDYGSIICRPRNPICSCCVIKEKCQSYKKNLQNIIPIKLVKEIKKRKKYSRAYVIFNEKNEILVRRRSSTGMLPSMLEIPNDKWKLNKKNLIKDKIIFKIKNKMQSKGFLKYSFSHFVLETEVFSQIVKKEKFQNYKWIKKNNINKSGLPTVMKKIVKLAL